MMLFNLDTKTFSPDYFVADKTNWVEVTQTDIDKISESLTNGGDVWLENGKLHCSGKAPSESHVFNLQTKQFEISEEKRTAFLEQTQSRYIDNIDNRAEDIYKYWTRFESEYRERQTAATAFKAANYQGDVSRYITDFAHHAGIDNKTATDLILVQAAGLEKLQLELANQRMRKYELKAPDLTLEQMQAIYDDIIATMDKLLEAYKNG